MDQSDNLNYWFFNFAVISNLYLFQEVVVLNPRFIFLKVDIIIKKQNDNWNIKYSIIYLRYCTSCCCCHLLSRWIFRCSWFSDITQYLDHDKLSCISQLNKGESRNLQKWPNHFNGTTTFAANLLLLFGALPINFALYLKDLVVVVLWLFILQLFASLFSLVKSFTSSL